MKKHILHPKLSFENMRDVIEFAGNEFAGKTAYSFRQSPLDRDVIKISFHQFRNEVRALASELLYMGCAGKHCAVIGRLSYDWAVIYFAMLSIGAVIVPLDKEWNSSDLADTAAKAKVEFLFIDEDISEKATEIQSAAALLAPAVYMNARKNKNNIRTLIAYGNLKFQTNPNAYFNADINTDKMSLLVFTSGTTGKGKGVMLSQNAIISDITAALPYIDYTDKTVGVLPPHHTYGSTVMFAAHAIIGAEIYVSSGLRYVSAELKEQKPGHMVLVPLYLETFYRKILATLKKQGKEALVNRMIKLSNGARKIGINGSNLLFKTLRDAFGGRLKTVICGGAPLNPDIIAFFDSIGIKVLNGYGITECAPLIAFNRSKNIVDNSVGNVIDIDTVKISKPNEYGEGEILVKGPNVMLGYYNDADATAEAIDKMGYFHTGDYGRLDKNNVLYITGRKKNLIILSNGKNVYPEEIENDFIATPGILEIVVYEGKSRSGMENNCIVAEIFPDKDYCNKNGVTDIKAHLKPFIDEYNKNAVAYKRIKLIKIRNEEFPKNTLRKIMRFKIDTTID